MAEVTGGIVEYTADHTSKLYQKVADQLSKTAGHTVAVEEVIPPHDLHPTHIQDVIGKGVGHVTELLEDKGLAARVETTPGPEALSYMREKVKKLWHLRGQENNKAA